MDGPAKERRPPIQLYQARKCFTGTAAAPAAAVAAGATAESKSEARPSPAPDSAKRLFDPSTDNPISPVPTKTSRGVAPSAAVSLPFHGSRGQKAPRPRKDHARRSRGPPIAARVDVRRSDPDGGFRRQQGRPSKPHDLELLQRPSSAPSSDHLPGRRDDGTAVAVRKSTPSAGPTSADVTSRQAQKPLLQLETLPISQSQLITEVKGIYAALVMLEAKCIDVDNRQAMAIKAAEPGRPPKLKDEQWQALIALHRSLLNEHHDFFLASQHPSASAACRRLASKYAMPARMWRHGIHSFLEILRHGLPESLDHMLSFNYLAYSMVALLYETIPAFEETWIECLGDLARYRMAIEDESLRDREVYAGVAASWYNKAADKSPNVGRLYHHLAILARPNALQQLYYYSRSLTCVQSFFSARESVLTLFDPILAGPEPLWFCAISVETSFIRTHGLLFTGRNPEALDGSLHDFLGKLDDHIASVTAKWKDQGIYMAITNIAALFEYGAPHALLRMALGASGTHAEVPPSVSMVGSPPAVGPESTLQSPSANRHDPAPSSRATTTLGPTSPTGERSELEKARLSGPPPETRARVPTLPTEDRIRSKAMIYQALRITFPTLKIALRRMSDKNVKLHVHVFLVFLLAVAPVAPAMDEIEQEIPWTELAAYLNTLPKPDRWQSIVARLPVFPVPDKPEIGRPLPEDFAMRGQLWSQDYFPPGWFEDSHVDDEERTLELPSMAVPRNARVFWLGVRIASLDCALSYDPASGAFSSTTVGGFERGVQMVIDPISDQSSPQFALTKSELKMLSPPWQPLDHLE